MAHNVPCSSRTISEMLPETHTMEKCDFSQNWINSQIIRFSVSYGFTHRTTFVDGTMLMSDF